MFLGINVDYSLFVLINIYEANNEPDQVKTFTDLGEILDSVGDNQKKNIIFGGDFNVIFDFFLKSRGGKPSLTKTYFSKTIQVKEKLNLIDIWRTRKSEIPKLKVLLSGNTIQQDLFKED